jgi:precorrin-4 methylase
VSGARVYFIGGGPGAADLLTLRGVRAIAVADVVVWGQSLVSEELVTEHARTTAELAPWPPLSAEGLLEVYDRAREDRLTVARVYGGDPTIYGWVHEEIASVTERGLPYEVVPGVTSMAAAAAAAGCILSGGSTWYQLPRRRAKWQDAPRPSPPLRPQS